MEDYSMLPNDKEWECLLKVNEYKSIIKNSLALKIKSLQEKINSTQNLLAADTTEGLRTEIDLLDDKFDLSRYKNAFKKIRTTCKREDILVSSTKLFSQFWSDYGLQHFSLGLIALWVEEIRLKEECIQKWVDILYPVNINIKDLLIEISVEQGKRRRKAMESGIRINTGFPYESISYEIDERFGKYC